MGMDRRTILAWGATVLLLSLCLMPKGWLPIRKESSASRIPHMDKVVHFTLFAAFGLLWSRVKSPTDWPRVGKVLSISLILAVGTELLQALPQIDRDPDVFDATADAMGALVGVGVIVGVGILGNRLRSGEVQEGEEFREASYHPRSADR
ncbi:MAG: hypothetical protein NVSMB9_05040 [Isosphaeraceae bacterium]